MTWLKELAAGSPLGLVTSLLVRESHDDLICLQVCTVNMRDKQRPASPTCRFRSVSDNEARSLASNVPVPARDACHQFNLSKQR